MYIFFQLIIWTELHEGLQPSYMQCFHEISFNLPPPFQHLTCHLISPACQQKERNSQDWIKLKYILKRSSMNWSQNNFSWSQWPLAVYSTLRIITVFTTACHVTQCEPDESSPQPLILFFNTHFDVMPTSSSSKWSLSFRFPHQNPVCISLLPIHATCPSHLILLNLFHHK